MDSYLDRDSKTMFAEVEYTSISKSDSVFIDDDFLENMSERFLFKKSPTVLPLGSVH